MKQSVIELEDEEGNIERGESASVFVDSGLNISLSHIDMLRDILSFDTKLKSVDFNELSTGIVYLKTIEEMSKSGNLDFDISEFHTTLRALGIKLEPIQAEVAYELISQKYDLNQLSLDKIIEIVKDTVDDMESIKENAQKLKEDRRRKLKEEGIDRSARLNISVPIFSPDEIKAYNKMKNNDLAQQIISKGEIFEDTEFECIPQSLFPTDPKRADGIEWMRIKDIEGVENPSLTCDGIDEGDVCQGAVGDCWFLSALSTVAQAGNEAIEYLFLNYNPELGFAQCRFFKNGDWIIVTIDDRIPTKNGRFTYARCRDLNEVWVPLIEKAYAKLHGSYESIESGVISNALVDLTGESSEAIIIEYGDDYWEVIKLSIEQKFFLGCAKADSKSDMEEDDGNGIIANHAYGILNAVEIDNKKMVRCRNPWGRHEWSGRWADYAKEWKKHPNMKDNLNVIFQEDGTFWMEYSDWANIFNRLYVLRTYTANSNWRFHKIVDAFSGISAGGCANNSTFGNNPQYLIESKEDSEVFISLRQGCLRLDGRKNEQYTPIGVSIFRKTEPDNLREVRLSEPEYKSIYPTRRENSFDCFLEGGVRYVIVPHTFEAGLEVPFVLSIYSEKDTILEKLEGNPEYPTCQGHFTEENSGGCSNYASWTQNPQYCLEVKNSKEIEILLQKTDGESTHIGFYVWKSNSRYKVYNKRENLILKSEIIKSDKVTGKISAEEGVIYTVMPFSFEPGHVFQFSLSVLDHSASLLEVNERDYESIQGEWTKEKSGGSQNNNSWKNNPVFPLIVHQDEELTVSLKVEDPLPIGFYIMTPDLKDTVHRIKFVNGTEVSTTAKLPAGEYAILPATFKPDVQHKFELNIYR
eukprot:TRINITY_DN842_c0_g1_i4.p1 TRINITY_DN842_c0_g1~~TRINITY_DN842_c0_g1_i4.p1  ORF type:complete len:864 (+),score=217.92 TRINITY_DN842_c0_g1_i4:513-3104(+)